MTTLHEAARQALEALSLAVDWYVHRGGKMDPDMDKHLAAIASLREALAQTQEPVAWKRDCFFYTRLEILPEHLRAEAVPLYAAPQPAAPVANPHLWVNPAPHAAPAIMPNFTVHHMTPEQAYKAAEPEGEIVVTKTPAGRIIAVTRQDSEGRILSVIAEAAEPAVDVDALLNAAVDFEVFLNTPPEYEDQRKVREFRHDAYRKWEKLRAALRMYLEGKE